MPPSAATQAAARLWIQRTPPLPARLSHHSSVEITRTLWLQKWFTRGRVREWKSGHNSVTVQNRTHVYMNFFVHKDLGNHLLQLCPKIVKHPVYYMQDFCQSGLGTADHACPIWSSSCCNGSLVTWTVVCLTAAKFKPVVGLRLVQYYEHLYFRDFIWLPLDAWQFCYILINIWYVETLLTNRWCPCS
jgi:hypothetical protein